MTRRVARAVRPGGPLLQLHQALVRVEAAGLNRELSIPTMSGARESKETVA